jgi:hypothetical protein
MDALESGFFSWVGAAIFLVALYALRAGGR